MKTLLLLSLVIVGRPSWGQDEVILQQSYKPNMVYKTTLTTSSVTELNFSGNEATIAKLKASGTELPIVVTGTTEMVSRTTTGSKKVDNSFPARLVFEKWKSSQKQNEQALKEDTSMTGLVIEGFYLNGTNLKIDTIISDTMDEQTRTAIKSMLESVQKQISFPKDPLKVGDEFEQTLPLKIPLGGQTQVLTVIGTKYRLVSIKNNKAIFDIKQTLTLDISVEQSNVSASGTGSGFSEFDITNGILSRYESDLTMTMTMDIAERNIVLTAKSTTKSKQLVTID